jgi:predicted SAM-dependent methyltransferase
MDLHTQSPIRLNLGAGGMLVEGWLSVGLEDRHDIRADLRELPLPDDHADEAMAIHVLEHFHRWEAVDVLREWRRVLKRGARLVLELPELTRCARNVLDPSCNERLGMWGLFGDPQYQDPLMVHKWCYRDTELRDLLKLAGYCKIHFAKPEWHGRKSMRDIRVECFK